MKIKRFLLVLLGGLFCNALVFAQSAPPTLEGKATQEMSDEGFAAAATRNYPLDSTIKITNTETGKEIELPVRGRIASSTNRIVDISLAAWEALELNSDTIVTLSLVPVLLPPPEIPDPPEWQTRSEQEEKQEERLAEIRATEIKQAEERQEEKLAEIRATEEKPAIEIPARGEPIQSNFSRPLYHLLVLDRTYCAFNSDIADIEGANILYKFKHGKNGYLITLYTSPEGSVFPVIPDKSRVLVNTIATRKIVLREHLNSSLFRRFVTNPTVLSQLRKALADIKIIPSLPKANSGKIYRLQVGAFAKPESAAAATRLLEYAGFAASEEQYGSLRRIFIKDIPAADVSSTVQRLEFAGFKEVWIRE
jgi:hypothetical protein